jgi:hypothetical protein
MRDGARSFFLNVITSDLSVKKHEDNKKNCWQKSEDKGKMVRDSASSFFFNVIRASPRDWPKRLVKITDLATL